MVALNKVLNLRRNWFLTKGVRVEIGIEIGNVLAGQVALFENCELRKSKHGLFAYMVESVRDNDDDDDAVLHGIAYLEKANGRHMKSIVLSVESALVLSLGKTKRNDETK